MISKYNYKDMLQYLSTYIQSVLDKTNPDEASAIIETYFGKFNTRWILFMINEVKEPKKSNYYGLHKILTYKDAFDITEKLLMKEDVSYCLTELDYHFTGEIEEKLDKYVTLGNESARKRLQKEAQIYIEYYPHIHAYEKKIESVTNDLKNHYAKKELEIFHMPYDDYLYEIVKNFGKKTIKKNNHTYIFNFSDLEKPVIYIGSEKECESKGFRLRIHYEEGVFIKKAFTKGGAFGYHPEVPEFRPYYKELDNLLEELFPRNVFRRKQQHLLEYLEGVHFMFPAPFPETFL